jgi:hypothetical protein
MSATKRAFSRNADGGRWITLNCGSSSNMRGTCRLSYATLTPVVADHTHPVVALTSR